MGGPNGGRDRTTRARCGHVGAADLAVEPQQSPHRGANAGRRRLRHGGRIRVLRLARRVRVSTRSGAGLCAPRPRTGVPRCCRNWRVVGGSTHRSARSRSGHRRTRCRGRSVGALALTAPRRSGCLLVRLPAWIPCVGEQSTALCRSVRGGDLARSAGHDVGCVDLAVTRHDSGNCHHWQPAFGSGGWIRMVRSRGRDARTFVAVAVVARET